MREGGIRGRIGGYYFSCGRVEVEVGFWVSLFGVYIYGRGKWGFSVGNREGWKGKEVRVGR